MNKITYEILFGISILASAGDSENLITFIIWHIVWIAIAIFCERKLERMK